MWLTDWPTILRVLLVGAASYTTLVVLLRVSGKRTLGKLNAFDLIATVALGSILATAVINPDQTWVGAAMAMVVVVGAQFVVAQVTTWLPRGRWFVNADPTLVVRHGQVLVDAMNDMRLTRNELDQAVRSTGRGSLKGVAAVVLEGDGTLSVITDDSVADASCLCDIRGWAAQDR